MKKIVSLLLITHTVLWSQNEVSFETSEGYGLGNINAQENWATTSYNFGEHIANQVVTDELSYEGSNSLKLQKEPALGPESFPLIGTYYQMENPVTFESFSTYLYLEPWTVNESSSDYLVGFVNNSQGVFLTYVRFHNDGNIYVNAKNPTTNQIYVAPTQGTWSGGGWVKLTLIKQGDNIQIYWNGDNIFTGLPARDIQFDEVRFVHTNKIGTAYVDAMNINNASLKVNEVNKPKFSFALTPNPVKKTLRIKMDSQFNSDKTEMKIISQNGKVIYSGKFNSSVNVENYALGVYYVVLNYENNYSKSLKFIKN